MGRIDAGAEGKARNVTKNRDNGLLLAVKGWQDPPKKHGGWPGRQAGWWVAWWLGCYVIAWRCETTQGLSVGVLKPLSCSAGVDCPA